MTFIFFFYYLNFYFKTQRTKIFLWLVFCSRFCRETVQNFYKNDHFFLTNVDNECFESCKMSVCFERQHLLKLGLEKSILWCK